MTTAYGQLPLLLTDPLTPVSPPSGDETGVGVELRPYQRQCLDSILSMYQDKGEHRLIAQLATGGGKTIIFAYLAMVLKVPTLILAHRDELLTQAISKIRYVWPEAEIGRVQAEWNETGRQITVASVQTLSRPNRFEKAFPTAESVARIGLVIIDEAHHAAAETYKFILDKFGLMKKVGKGVKAPLSLGVTATPLRGDKKWIGDVYDRFAFQWSIRDGIREGFLCDLAGYVLHFENEEFGEIHTVAGDYNQGELDKAVKNVARCEAIVKSWKERASDRLTVVFCVSKDHAKMMKDTFERSGVKAGVVYDGLSREARRKVLEDFEDGTIRVVCNCMILTEGWDAPPTNCVVVARPTQSQSLYLQMIGRGTRLSPKTGKTNCLILDVADVSRKHSVAAPVTLGEVLELPGEKKQQKEIQSAFQLIWEDEDDGGERPAGAPKSVRFRDVKGGEEFDPLAELAAARMNWIRGKGGYVLSLPQVKPDSRHYLVVKRRKDWLFDIYHVRQQKEENAGGFPVWRGQEKFVNPVGGLPDMTAAIAIAEKYASKVTKSFYNVEKMKGKDAAWSQKEQPATEKQLEMLRKFRRPTMTEDGQPLTKGEASRRIDECFANRIKVKLERQPEELDVF
jgi:superfamily II DNA or RNA helicase